ncbi:lytic transglycosylase domain-containing protein [Nocardioides sp. GCM10027113]|uniref:aggregation-promoting factor C-terminal-like domain-containing protein n=1 Tax=unclassified Nocardioides TaxID=2615069 RepID=UPI00360EBC56
MPQLPALPRLASRLTRRPDREHYAPKHRQVAPSLGDASRRAVRSSVLLSTAVVATAGVVATGVAGGPAITNTAGDLAETVPTPSDLASNVASSDASPDEEREVPVTRSDRRTADPAKKAALSQEDGPAVTREESLSDEAPRDIARALLPEYGFSSDQYQCLDALYVSESNWRVDADNPTSSAYGIPQALTELHDLPAGYMTSAEVQIRWGLDYIRDAYGSPCSAWSFKQANNWY